MLTRRAEKRESERGSWTSKRAPWITAGGAVLAACITIIFNLIGPSRSPYIQPIVVKEDSGTHVHEIGPPSAEQFVSKERLGGLDRTNYHIDTGLALAFIKPRGDEWEYGPVDNYNSMTMLDIPSVGQLFFPADQTDGLKVYAIRERTPFILTITAESKVEGQYADINPFASSDIQDALIRNGVMNAMRWFDHHNQNISPEDRSAAHHEIEHVVTEQTKEFLLWNIERRFPIKKVIYSGIYVSRMSKEYLRRQLINRVLPRKDLFSMSVQYAIGSKGIGLSNLKNVVINSNDQIASYDCSVALSDVLVNGYIAKNETLQNVGFIRVAGTEVILVDLVYVNAGRDSSVYLNELLRVYKSLYFVVYGG